MKYNYYVLQKGYQCILTTSMGKDSKLSEYLLQKITNNYKPIFNNTTLDSSDVYKEVKARNDIEIVTVKDNNGKNKSFYNMIKIHGTPLRFRRWCCSTFKENGTLQRFENINNLLFIMGMRNEESSTRSNYGSICRNPQWEDKSWIGCLPIRKWTELELWLYTIHNKIPINKKYLNGYSRVGCHIACPYYTKSTWILDSYYYPKQYDRFHKILEDGFKQEEKWCRMNCTCTEYHSNWNGGILRDIPNTETIKEFMEYKGLEDKELAEQYFKKKCVYCGKSVYHKDVVAMNLKMYGRGINKFKCKKCLMEELSWSKEDWIEQVEKFKEQGCKLF
ncbi:MAG: phosphoadenosine phosphosulfate reductase family protein [Bacilli bacterium]